MKCLIVLTLAYISIGCAGKNPDLCQIQTPGSTAYVHSFGDSITAGAGSDHFCNSYQALFTQDVGMNGDNMAVSGSPLVSTVEYGNMMAMFLDNGTEHVGSFQDSPQDINTLLTGHNDLRLFGMDPDHFATFQQEFIQSLEHLSSLGHMTLVGTTLYITDAMQVQFPGWSNANVDTYVAFEKSAVAAMQAQGYPLVLVDTNAVFDPNTMTTNDVHPNDFGHATLAKTFLSAYQGAL